jgi:hypothetical protein
MTAFNVVRFRVKPGREQEFLDAHRRRKAKGRVACCSPFSMLSTGLAHPTRGIMHGDRAPLEPSQTALRSCRLLRQRALSTGQEGALMRYKPKNIAALQVALGGLPDKMRVEVDADIGASPKTVGELRKVTAWAENLVITTPQQRDPASAVRVSKASVATRVSPKQ